MAQLRRPEGAGGRKRGAGLIFGTAVGVFVGDLVVSYRIEMRSTISVTIACLARLTGRGNSVVTGSISPENDKSSEPKISEGFERAKRGLLVWGSILAVFAFAHPAPLPFNSTLPATDVTLPATGFGIALDFAHAQIMVWAAATYYFWMLRSEHRIASRNQLQALFAPDVDIDSELERIAKETEQMAGQAIQYARGVEQFALSRLSDDHTGQLRESFSHAMGVKNFFPSQFFQDVAMLAENNEELTNQNRSEWVANALATSAAK